MTFDLAAVVRAELVREGYTPDRPLAVGYSGGIDSTALLLLAIEVCRPGKVVALHIDHSVRERSPLDADHCRRIAEELGVPFFLRQIPATHLSPLKRACGLEGALRQLRYSLLEELCLEQGIDYLATGHQAEDRVETHLLAMTRGSGLTGLAGPRSTRSLGSKVRLLRPLLGISRRQLTDYLATCWPGIPVIQDESNTDDQFWRNRIRHRLLPELVELAGGIEPIIRSIAQLGEDREAFEWMIEQRQQALGIDPDGAVLRLDRVDDMTDPAVVFALRRYLAEHTGGGPPAQKTVLAFCNALMQPGRTRWFDVGGTRFCIANRTVAAQPAQVEHHAVPPVLLRLGEPVFSRSLEVTLTAQIIRMKPDVAPSRSSNQVQFDAGVLGPIEERGLILRAAQPGDRFSPYGLQGSTRLFRWLAGRGVPRLARSRVPVVVWGEEILWVVGMRRGSQAPITSETRERLCLTALRHSG
ncbi:MAG: tRNA lysidine(34) synthetase TilS [Bradymonadales bacterium]|nr:tRNA lysidine(34) synthetase TilS [Bradymonadales bacterium]